MPSAPGFIMIEELAAINALGGFEHVESTTNRILEKHGFLRGMFTSRERALLTRGEEPPTTQVVFNFDARKSLCGNIADLFQLAKDAQPRTGQTDYVGAMLQYLVAAQLDLIVGAGKIEHRRFSVADDSSDRKSHFQIDSVAIHVTTHPCEALIRKCGDNLRTGLIPLVLTVGDNVTATTVLLKNADLGDHVDVLDASQFFAANILKLGSFSATQCKLALTTILKRYNEIVAMCETDASLLIRLSN